MLSLSFGIVSRRPGLVKLLFVCTGNICRSPLAEGLMRALAEKNGLAEEIVSDSAATHDYQIGDIPDPRSIAEAARHGVDISGHYARQVEESDFEEFDMILALDRGHRAILSRMAPASAKHRVRLLMDFSPKDPPDVPDPYYGNDNGFPPVTAQIERGVK